MTQLMRIRSISGCIWYIMIKAPKVIVTTQEKLVVGTRTLGAPQHEHEVGKGLHEMRVSGRIVGVRSTEQSVFNQNVTFGVLIM